MGLEFTERPYLMSVTDTKDDNLSQVSMVQTKKIS
jgi:hypothetical protein